MHLGCGVQIGTAQEFVQHVLIRTETGFSRVKGAGRYQCLCHRMIHRQLIAHRGANEVRPAIAEIGDVDPAVLLQGDDGGGAHASAFRWLRPDSTIASFVSCMARTAHLPASHERPAGHGSRAG